MNSRTKGHNFERFVRKDFEDMGFNKVVTTRNGSTLLDSCGIDLMNIPIHIQCKAGYETRKPDFLKLKGKTLELLKKKLEEEDPNTKKPFVLIHKTKGNDITVTLDYDFFKELVAKYYNT